MSVPALPTIGTKFLHRRTPKVRELAVFTVEDIWTTTNAAGKIVRTEYRCSHVFLGCKMEEAFPVVSIQMAIADHGIPVVLHG